MTQLDSVSVVSGSDSGLIIPTYDELRKEFNWVGGGFNGEATDWQLDDSCKGVATADPDACELVHYNRVMSTQEVRDDLKNRHRRPVTLDELLMYARKYPDKQKEFPIVALGVSCLWRDRRSLPCLDWFGIGRFLDLGWDGLGWFGDYRLLAVRA